MFDLDPAQFDSNGVLSFEHLITAVAAGHKHSHRSDRVGFR
jgi:hypothetical protein